jgi:ADP-ribose pyrophosphatase YjhB (NUDIX family)
VVVVVVQYLDKLLFARRNIEPGKGLWNFCGGYVDRGETVEDAAIREVKEESNLDIELGNLIGVYSEAGDSHIVIAYEAQIDEHQVDCLAAQPEEVGELAFFRWEELPTFAFPVHHRILQDLKRLKG